MFVQNPNFCTLVIFYSHHFISRRLLIWKSKISKKEWVAESSTFLCLPPQYQQRIVSFDMIITIKTQDQEPKDDLDSQSGFHKDGMLG